MEVIQCVRCKGTEFIDDDIEGFTICTSCGTVLPDRIISDHSDNVLTTPDIHFKSQWENSPRAEKHGFSASIRLMEDLAQSLPLSVHEAAHNILEKTASLRLETIPPQDYLVAAALFIAFRCHHNPRPMAEICRLLGGLVVPRAISIHNHLVGKLVLPELSRQKPDSPPTEFKKPKIAGTIISRWCNALGVRDLQVQRRCEEVSRILKDSVAGVHPRVVAASAIYIVTQTEGVGLNDVADLTSIGASVILSVVNAAGSESPRKAKKPKPISRRRDSDRRGVAS
jgi:transcription initiation factor TFIIIB Brf1 subunit/transcription initiation factor TFIIB